MVTQVHQRLCRGIYTIDAYRRTFRCYNRIKHKLKKEEQQPAEPKKKKVVKQNNKLIQMV